MDHREEKAQNQRSTNDRSRIGWENWLTTVTNNHPLLTADEEIILGRQVQAMMQVLDTMKAEGRTKPKTKAERLCIKRGRKAKDRFILGNVRLVKKVAIKFTGRTKCPIEDLMQDGLIGLNRAAEKYDPERGYKFSTYAFWWIRQSMNRAIGISEYTIRLPGQYHEVMAKVNQFTQDFFQEHKRKPTFDELYENSGAKSKDTFRSFIDLSAGVTSINNLVTHRTGKQDKHTLIDVIADKNEADPYTNIYKNDNAEYLLIAVHDLTDPIHKAIILNELQEKPETVTVLSRELKISRENLRQKKKQAFWILRRKLRHQL